MFSAEQLFGMALKGVAKKTLFLTFDDGPGVTNGNGAGPKTQKIAEYLHAENIPATFFVTGKNAAAYPEVLAKLHELGHLIGNHTYNHPNLTAVDDDYDIVGELIATNKEIAPYIKNNTVYLRPPYGNWSAKVAAKLNKGLYEQTSYDYMGPFYSDIDGSDWACWRDGKTGAECAAGYLELILKKKRLFFNSANDLNKHIVLMHDSTADDEQMMNNNRTYEALQVMIPILKEKGYSFDRLDNIKPEVLRRQYAYTARADYKP